MSSTKKIHRLVVALTKQGATSRPLKSGGYLMYLPGGGTTTIHTSPSDRRAEKNLRAIITRAGMDWPKV